MTAPAADPSPPHRYARKVIGDLVASGRALDSIEPREVTNIMIGAANIFIGPRQPLKWADRAAAERETHAIVVEVLAEMRARH